MVPYMKIMHFQVPKNTLPPKFFWRTVHNCIRILLSSSINPDSINNIKAERHIDDNGCNVNGIAEAQCFLIYQRPPVSVAAIENGDDFAKPYHLDSKYLRQVDSVSNMEVWSEYENEDWLFSSSNFSPKPTENFEVDETFQVWAQALRIQSADVFALPYATPF